MTPSRKAASPVKIKESGSKVPLHRNSYPDIEYHSPNSSNTLCPHEDPRVKNARREERKKAPLVRRATRLSDIEIFNHQTRQSTKHVRMGTPMMAPPRIDIILNFLA